MFSTGLITPTNAIPIPLISKENMPDKALILILLN
jgi:hypothetical protein